LVAGFDRWHDAPWGDKVFLSRYLTLATHKLARIRRNIAETHRMESTQKSGISVEKNRVLIDRRLSVAPMMDWTH
jgi:hypothetical protein